MENRNVSLNINKNILAQCVYMGCWYICSIWIPWCLIHFSRDGLSLFRISLLNVLLIWCEYYIDDNIIYLFFCCLYFFILCCVVHQPQKNKTFCKKNLSISHFCTGTIATFVPKIVCICVYVGEKCDVYWNHFFKNFMVILADSKK